MKILINCFILILTFGIILAGDENKSEKTKQVKALIVKLADQDYHTRELATKELITYLPEYKDLIEKELKTSEDLESIERLEYLLKMWEEKKIEIAHELAFKAKSLMDEKKYDEALIAIEQSLQIKKFSSISIESYLNLNEHLGRYKQNISFLKDLLKEQEKNESFFLNTDLDLENIYQALIQNLIDLKDFSQAIEVSNKYLILSRLELDAKRTKAIVLEQAGKYDEAEAILNDLIDKNIDQHYFQQLLIDFSIRRNKPIEKYLEKFLKNKPEDERKDTEQFMSIYFYYGQKQKVSLEILEKSFIHSFKMELKKESISSFTLQNQDWFYLMLYLFLQSQSQMPQDLELTNCYKKLDLESRQVWPSPILGFYSGDISEKDLIKFATSNSVKETKEKLCEAHFYIGLHYLIKNDTENATAHLKKCLENNILNYIEPTIAAFLLNKKN